MLEVISDGENSFYSDTVKRHKKYIGFENYNIKEGYPNKESITYFFLPIHTARQFRCLIGTSGVDVTKTCDLVLKNGSQ